MKRPMFVRDIKPASGRPTWLDFPACNVLIQHQSDGQWAVMPRTRPASYHPSPLAAFNAARSYLAR